MKGIGKISLTVLKNLQSKGGEAEQKNVNLTDYNTTRLLKIGAIKQGNLTCTSGYRIALTDQSIQHLKTHNT